MYQGLNLRQTRFLLVVTVQDHSFGVLKLQSEAVRLLGVGGDTSDGTDCHELHFVLLHHTGLLQVVLATGKVSVIVTLVKREESVLISGVVRCPD